ncbi:hypothetical protein KIN20_004242 [Parelaphostrongylus tenuis]|uniref:NET domain-containing protein n=1 Tax=Parelaphostrongylus tenuis TaxID=148309 RepID=A0AAD5QGR8_PARTN|nr:hypothetical protein KIN20_004242 [Parelaphostrongylus tenuis]
MPYKKSTELCKLRVSLEQIMQSFLSYRRLRRRVGVTEQAEGSTVSEEVPFSIKEIRIEDDENENTGVADSVPDADHEEENEAMSYMEQLLLAEHLQLLNDDQMGTVVDIILKHDGLTIPDDENDSISIAFRDLKPITLREIATYVDSVLSSSPTSGNDDSKTKKARRRVTAPVESLSRPEKEVC